MKTRTGPARPDALPLDLPLGVINAAQGVGGILERIVAHTNGVISLLRSTVAELPPLAPTDAGGSKRRHSRPAVVISVTDERAERIL